MGQRFRFAGNIDFGAFAFKGDVVYDIDDLGDTAPTIEQLQAAGAALEGEAKEEAPKRRKKTESEE